MVPQRFNPRQSVYQYLIADIPPQLSMDLLRNYPAGYNVLPTANPHDVVNITLQLALYHIVDMNERAQTLTTNCEIITKWHDVFLMWNPEDYDNIRDTRLPWERVWTPDIVLYNAAGDGEQGREMRTLIQVATQASHTLGLSLSLSLSLLLPLSLSLSRLITKET